ncbi:MAG: PIN domain-containing protein [Nanoarchaeota archaeon]|nr:PIN domain-containing protein [Nanoarchaeota archaeon]
MEVILDTNFIISCIVKKIDFLSQLRERGFRVLVPREVLQELKDVRLQSKTAHEERMAIDIALEMLASKQIEKTTIGKGKVDDLLIRRGLEGVYIATLDNGIKRRIPNKVVILNSKKEVGVERS